MCKITKNKDTCLAHAAVPQHSLHIHSSPPISHAFEFTLHELAGLSIFVPLFIKMAAQEGNKEINIISYYFHVFIVQKTFIL